MKDNNVILRAKQNAILRAKAKCHPEGESKCHPEGEARRILMRRFFAALRMTYGVWNDGQPPEQYVVHGMTGSLQNNMQCME